MPSKSPYEMQPIIPDGSTGLLKKKKPLLRWIILTFVALVATVIIGGLTWYNVNTGAVDPNDTQPIAVSVKSGSSPSAIATTLKQAGVIKSELAFDIYTKLAGKRSSLQAGDYIFTKSQNLEEIVTSMVKGPSSNDITVTFKPGATLAENKEVLRKLGYSDTDIDAGMKIDFDHPMFEGKPQTADLEGYLYGETYRFAKGTSVRAIVVRFLDDFYEVVKQNDLISLYKQQGLSLYQGITLASIIQRESGGDDKAQIAQVFLLRLSKGMMLGSDVTYQYIADKLGITRDPNIHNKYNTRVYTGLPPGPIATPGKDALLAVGKPASGDYLFFLSGDDGITYFARTNEEHNLNIQNHCRQKCQIL